MTPSRRFAADTGAPSVRGASTADGSLDTQEFAHVIHRQQPDQPAAADDRNGVALVFLQALKRDVDHVRCIGGQEIAPHDVGHRRLLLLTCDA